MEVVGQRYSHHDKGLVKVLCGVLTAKNLPMQPNAAAESYEMQKGRRLTWWIPLQFIDDPGKDLCSVVGCVLHVGEPLLQLAHGF